MQKFVIPLLFISGVIQASAQSADSTFRQRVCEQCNSWCSAEPTSQPATTISPQKPKSCQDVSLESAKSTSGTGGVVTLDIPEIGSKDVFCDFKTDGGNWIVFHRKTWRGAVSFKRGWNDYVNGFGDVNGEFWLGLEAIHQLTKTGNYELRIDMTEAFSGKVYYAKYDSFKIGPASDNYRLSVSGYSGTATDSLANGKSAGHNGMQFSTPDRDNDSGSLNCASSVGTGWWFNSCGSSYLTSDRWVQHERNAMIILKHTAMKLRQKQIAE